MKQQQPTLFTEVRPRIISLALACMLGTGLLMTTFWLMPVTDAAADGPDSAHVVIQFDGQRAIVRPISFTAPISGFTALQLTGLELVISSTTKFGPAVCGIAGAGNQADNCFGGGFWAYSFWNGSAWEAYPVGAGNSVISNGMIDRWTWSPNFVSPPAVGSGPQFVSGVKALSWLAGQQVITTGGYGKVSGSIEVMMAIGANGYHANQWQRNADSPTLLSHVLGDGAAYAKNGAAAAGKLAVGVSAANGCYPHNALRPSDTYLSSSGIYTGGFGAGGAGPQSWGILGTLALSETVPAAAVTHLKSRTNADGGWSWGGGSSSDTNGTALAIQALAAAGESLTSSTVMSGLAYLKSVQNGDGGFPYTASKTGDAKSDTNSTAYIVQAIRAAGQDPMTGTWRISSTNPISYLLGMQRADGSFEWQPGLGPNQLATQQAIPAILGHAFPIRRADVPACQAVFLPLTVKE